MNCKIIKKNKDIVLNWIHDSLLKQQREYFRLELVGQYGRADVILADGNFNDVKNKIIELIFEYYSDDETNSKIEDFYCNVENYNENNFKQAYPKDFYCDLYEDIYLINELFCTGKIVWKWYENGEIVMQINAF